MTHRPLTLNDICVVVGCLGCVVMSLVVCMFVGVPVCVCVCLCVTFCNTCVCTYVCVCVCVSVCAFFAIHVYAHMCMHARVCVCVCVCKILHPYATCITVHFNLLLMVVLATGVRHLLWHFESCHLPRHSISLKLNGVGGAVCLCVCVFVSV